MNQHLREADKQPRRQPLDSWASGIVRRLRWNAERWTFAEFCEVMGWDVADEYSVQRWHDFQDAARLLGSFTEPMLDRLCQGGGDGKATD